MNCNDTEAVMSFLREKDGSRSEVIVDSEIDFKGLFYQDSYMRNVFGMFPELVLVDATYKLLEL